METNYNFKKYTRQIRLPEIGAEGQRKIRDAKVLVVGAGGLGCPVLQSLAAMGVGTLGFIDNDVVDVTNLHRQILFSPQDVDKPKVLAAKEYLSKLNPDVELHDYFQKLSTKNALDLLAGYDVIVEGSDNFPTKYLVNDACVILGKPLVYGAVNRFEGQLTVFNYNQGPTLRCLLPEPPDPLEVPSCSQTGVLGSLPTVIGALQATEVIKIITGAGTTLSGTVYSLHCLHPEGHFFRLERNPDTANVTRLKEYNDFCADHIQIPEIEAAEFLKLKPSNEKDVLVVNVSDEKPDDLHKYAQSHVYLSDVPGHLEYFASYEKIVVVCGYGIQSKSAVHYLLKNMPGKQIFGLKGGLAVLEIGVV